MSEYWVSQAKYYCKFCNAWMADNKPSRMNHEFSAKHKENVELFNKKKREESLFGSQNKEDVKMQLELIDKLARDAIKEDRREFSDLYKSSAMPPLVAPQIAQQHAATATVIVSVPGSSGADSIANQSPDNGLHNVRGQYYLEGKKNEKVLNVGLTCQLFVESLDDWFDAVIINRKTTHTPKSNLEIALLDVQYIVTEKNNKPQETLVSLDKSASSQSRHSDFDTTLNSAKRSGIDNRPAWLTNTTVCEPDGVAGSSLGNMNENEGRAGLGEGEDCRDPIDEEQKVVTEVEVQSDRLRIYSNEIGEVLHIDGNLVDDDSTATDEKVREDINKKVYNAPVEENTGFSRWTTVSVQVINEKDVIKNQKALEKQAKKQSELNRTLVAKREEAVQSMLSNGSDPLDTLGEYNPNGSNSYRGIQMGDDFLHTGDVKIAPEGVVVGFKKRKAPGGGGSRDRDNSGGDDGGNNRDNNKDMGGNGNYDNNRDLTSRNASNSISAPLNGLSSHSVMCKSQSQAESQRSSDITEDMTKNTRNGAPSSSEPSSSLANKVVMSIKKPNNMMNNKKFRTPDFDD